MGTLLYVVRHGRTADNANKVFQGQGGSRLDEVGAAQAERIAARLAGASIDRVVTSDLERARQTAERIAAASGLAPPWERADLREVDVGAWTGKPFDVVREEHAEEWAAWCAGIDVRRGGGETYAELALRISTAMLDVAREHEGRRVAVVSHGAAIRALVMHTLGLSYAEASRALGAVVNTALTTFEATDRLRMLSYNDAAHLDGMPVD